MINFGIIGAGHIAQTMATTVMQMEEVHLYGIASRSMDRALQYKEQYHMEVAYDSYEALAEDEKVDVIYIATPHSFHYEQALMCLEKGKHVLCEKAFTINEKQARELVKTAEEKGLFLGEAIWTRFMPMAHKLQELIRSGVIGEVTHMTANLNFPMLHKERLVKAELAGGALLDVGIYPLTLASLVMGDEIERIRAVGVLNKQGVDKVGQYTLIYKNGAIADLNSGMCSISDGDAYISGTGGLIVVKGVNFLRQIQVFNNQWDLIEEYEPKDVGEYPYRNGESVTGYEYEVKACAEAILAGKTECEEMTHQQTVFMMHVMDEIRKQMGVRYPGE